MSKSNSDAVVPAAPVKHAQRRLLLGMAPLALLFLLAGCYGRHIAATTQPTSPLTGLSEPAPLEVVEAIVAPPLGWKPDPLKQSATHKHQVWISPTGNTAYGVIHVQMPLPLGPDLALIGFMSSMRKSEGEGILLEHHTDPALPGIRFVAEGGLYKLRAILVTRDWVAWAVYAGTLRGKPEIAGELNLAERAREATIIGLPQTK